MRTQKYGTEKLVIIEILNIGLRPLASNQDYKKTPPLSSIPSVMVRGGKKRFCDQYPSFQSLSLETKLAEAFDSPRYVTIPVLDFSHE